MNGLVRNRGNFLVVLLITALAGCSPEGKYSEKDFVGKWMSTKSPSPIVLYANGEWEILSDAGGVLQYGVWQVITGSKIMWSFKSGAKILHDRNKILTVSEREFTLREADNKVTTFRRLE